MGSTEIPYLAAIQDYHVKIQYMSGKENVMTDVLIKLREKENYKRGHGKTKVTIQILNYKWTLEIEEKLRIPQMQKEDKKIRDLGRQILRNPNEVTRSEIIEDNLYHADVATYQIFVPQ